MKKKVTYILDGLRVSKLTANFRLWVIYPFKAPVDKHYICNTTAKFSLNFNELKKKKKKKT